MPDLLIVAATHTESAFITGSSKNVLRKQLFSLPDNSGFTSDLIITGPGITATTYHLTKLLSQKKYKLVLNIGICGSVDSNIKPVRLVKVISDRFGDFGVDDKGTFTDVFEMGITSPDVFPFKNGILKPKAVTGFQSLKALPQVNGITVQQITGSKKGANRLMEKYGPAIETMEGAAFFYVCMHEKVDCIQIRSVSNMVEARQREKWKVKEAIDALEGIAGLFISEIRSKMR